MAGGLPCRIAASTEKLKVVSMVLERDMHDYDVVGKWVCMYMLYALRERRGRM